MNHAFIDTKVLLKQITWVKVENYIFYGETCFVSLQLVPGILTCICILNYIKADQPCQSFSHGYTSKSQYKQVCI